ncbi:tetratricopeptide repeat protein [Hoeflea sp. WL0058]|uniref:Tetratricopeptide repeat protein n=2 Tax=Flavimaribacter sediminis TaxID=2865987 RepID=A0AAE2ZP14_9HYPH|nr:tetratricopeptide repeat protein [Flavimaribacter sediminis]
MKSISRGALSSGLRMSTGILAIALLASGCANNVSRQTTGSIARSSEQLSTMNATQLLKAESKFAAAYKANPKDKATGINYATVLRMVGRDSQALAVMQQVAIAHPSDRDVLASYGKAQAAAGQLEAALSTIKRAQTPDRPDWKLLSAEAAILDQLGKTEQARGLYRQALDLAPDEPTILSNLGMSYLLTGDLRTSETYLKKAVARPGADSRVRQNLALVVGLQGRFDEAQRIAQSELSREQADANMAYLRTMLAQQNAWAKLEDKKNTN